MNLDEQQRAALDQLNEGKNCFLTGSAGTGKSTVTTAFIGASLKAVTVAATTGIAAINLRDSYAARAGRAVNVSTIYRWAGIGLGPKDGQGFDEFWMWWRANNKGFRRTCERISNTECLIIDEISMLPGRILDYLDFHCRQIRGGDRPFGGIQLVCVGDFLQLPPVAKDGSAYDWAFATQAWQAAGFTPAVLRTIHRQADPVFSELLNAFRVGRITGAMADVLASRVSPFCNPDIPRLFTHNMAVDKWNGAMLASLNSGEAREYKAILTGEHQSQKDWLLKNMITPYVLTIKAGARVMVTSNIAIDNELVASNGTLATVINCDSENEVHIKTDDGADLLVRPVRWTFDPQEPDSAAFIQIPLRLAWAATIHKSQGLTLKDAWIDIRAARDPGQAYVAVSRVKSLAGLHLKAMPGGIMTSPAAIRFHEELERAPIAKQEPVYLY